MRSVFLSLQLSLDGYMASQSGQPDFAKDSLTSEVFGYVGGTLIQSDTLVLGRVAYEEQAGYWPTAVGEYAANMNAIDKLVFTSMLQQLDWSNSRLAASSLAEEIATLKSQPGSNIFVSGGARMAQSFIRERLLDELFLYIHPVTVGSGTPLFLDQHQLTLKETRPFEGGVVLHRYALT
ncbi:MAG: dihydrofolate reductase family protein [Thermomicrobiales bacterium]